MVFTLATLPAQAQEPPERKEGIPTFRLQVRPAPSQGWPSWIEDLHYGAYFDLGYLQDFNNPENHLWRSKTTTRRVNQLAPNMILGYIRKEATTKSRWGFEFGVQGGLDVNGLVPGPLPQATGTVGGADTLSHFYRANASYLVPIGNGLKVTAGLFNSYIGYESFLAKDNLNYTRAYIADQSPYFLFGVGMHYPVSEQLQIGLYIVNGFSYLAEPNQVPSYGTQVIWKPVSNLTFKENVYWGPDQSNISLKFWRLFSDSLLEWTGDHGKVALAYNFGTEQSASSSGNPRNIWMGSALWVGRHLSGPWSVAVRPEFYWDPAGLITGDKQLIWAVTNTLEYKVTLPVVYQTGLIRLEYRFDRSTGSGGGFYKGGQISPGVIGLTPNQHLVIVSLMWSFDSP